MKIIGGERSQTQAELRGKVFILGHPDGTVQGYAEKDIDIIFRLLPRVSTRQAEILAEELVELTLPRPYANIFYPGNLRVSGKIQELTVQDIARAIDDISIAKAFNEFARQLKDTPKWSA